LCVSVSLCALVSLSRLYGRVGWMIGTNKEYTQNLKLTFKGVLSKEKTHSFKRPSAVHHYDILYGRKRLKKAQLFTEEDFAELEEILKSTIPIAKSTGIRTSKVENKKQKSNKASSAF
ncbi:hypothetical protein PO124_09080, partial [Bacillus licheniformis]|nr:hypothetical protein [Bacillus licheniformis]